jgi:PhzF family phenazine biosynthesis protein
MGTSYTLVHEYDEKSPLKFHTKSGEITVEIVHNQVTLNFPIWTISKSDKKEIVDSLGVKEYEELYIGDAVPFAIIMLKNQEQVKNFNPTILALKEYCKSHDIQAVGITAKGDDVYDYVLRAFAPSEGIDEDPGTGIAQCLIAPYWGKVLGKKVMKVGQLSERGSEMTVEVMDDGVRITGSVTPLIKGILSL